MEIHQLEYFVAVAETGSFTRAAERCRVAQPSLSQQIKKLEQELGFPLFDRLPRKVSLTEAGSILLPRARSILDDINCMKYDLHKDLEQGFGSLSTGFIPTIASFVLPRVIQSFSKKYPQAYLSVHEDLTGSLVQGLVDGWLDIAVMSLPVHSDLIETHELLTEPLVVASRRRIDHPHPHPLPAKDLAKFPFIALSEMHCLGEQVNAFCYKQNVDLNVVCHTTQLTTVQSCVAQGLGISLVPQAMSSSDRSDLILYQPVSDAAPQRVIIAATRQGRQVSFLAHQFMEIVRAEYPRK